jgi:hypothetical protein
MKKLVKNRKAICYNTCTKIFIPQIILFFKRYFMEFVVSNKVLKEIKIDYQKDDVKDLVIPNGVEVLGEGALCYIPLGLESIYIPKSVKVIESFDYLQSAPFYGCSEKLTIYCEVSEKPQHWSDYWNYRGQNDEIFVYWESDKY